ncbi:MAG: threonine/serine dehydratase [Gaiella sp.]
MSPAQPIPTAADVDAAAARLAGLAVRTPLLHSPALDERVRARVFLKPETLQRTGSFKFRGAYNRLSALTAGERERGVVAFSSGNHAQGVAAAAALLGMRATIVMPADAPAAKRSRTEAFGAAIVEYDRERDDREAIARGLAGELGATLVPPYDDPYVIAGQGTVGLEIAEDLERAGAAPDLVAVNVSGGGLIAGVSLAVTRRFPGARVFAAEPAGFDDHARSLAGGSRLRNTRVTGSICDALLASEPGELTFEINRALLAGGVAATDEEVERAVAFAFRELKLVVEPSGAVALAALLDGRLDAEGKTVVIVLSGGNVDAEAFSRMVGLDHLE